MQIADSFVYNSLIISKNPHQHFREKGCANGKNQRNTHGDAVGQAHNLTDRISISTAPILAGQNPCPASQAKVNHHKNKAYLIGQRRCAHSHFTQLSQHDRIQHANRRCYHILQCDRHRNGQNRFVKIFVSDNQTHKSSSHQWHPSWKIKNDPQDPFSKNPLSKKQADFLF